jgi:hypothetical protein
VTWTYSSTDLSTTLAKVRRLIGDTNTNDQWLTDEEINWIVGEQSTANAYLAAADIADTILASALLRKCDRNGPSFGAQRSQIVQHCRDLAKDLRKRADQRATPSCFGASEDEYETLTSDTDFVQPAFTRGKFDHE